MKIIVTGGCGFIGSAFIRYLLKEYEDDVINIDSLTYAANPASVEQEVKLYGGKGRYKFLQYNVCDLPRMVDLFMWHKPDAVIHFAAESHVDNSIIGPIPVIRTNVWGTTCILEACRGLAIPPKLLYVSTDEVYGALGFGDAPFTEETPLNPHSPYSASKAAADMMVRAYGHTYGMPVLVTRCTNNYGPWQHPEKMIPKMIINALEDERLPVYGKGLNVRDWIYVDDHVKALDMVLRFGDIGEIYNIGGGEERSNIQVVRAILKYLGKGEELIQFVNDRPGHDLRYAIDYTKLFKKMAWWPMVDFDTGIKNTINWYREKAEEWEEVNEGTDQLPH